MSAGFLWLGVKLPDGSFDQSRAPHDNSVRSWWSCPKGHRWEAAYGNLYRGCGCPYCSGRLIAGLVPAETVRDYVQKHGLTQATYQKASKEGELPEGFPGGPVHQYDKPWSWFSGRSGGAPGHTHKE